MDTTEDKNQNNKKKEPIRYDKFFEKFNDTTMTCLPKYNNCVHHIDGLTCKAFDVITDSILFGENNHSKPLKIQQNNLVYEKKINYHSR